MKYSELLTLTPEYRISKNDFTINTSYSAAQMFFIKLTHRSGRVCYTWSDIPPTSRRPVKLRSVTPNEHPEAIMSGSYAMVTPSCDGVVGEFSNHIEILNVNGGSTTKPGKISLYDETSTAPYKQPVVFPLVSFDNLGNTSWIERHDELMRAVGDNINLTLLKRVDMIVEIAENYEDVVEILSEQMRDAQTKLLISQSDEENIDAIRQIDLAVSTLRSIDSLSYKMRPLLEMLKLRTVSG